MKTDAFTFPDVAWQAVKRRGALKEKDLAPSEPEVPLTERKSPTFSNIVLKIQPLPYNFSSNCRTTTDGFTSTSYNFPVVHIVIDNVETHNRPDNINTNTR